jgi:hypothetical protein
METSRRQTLDKPERLNREMDAIFFLRRVKSANGWPEGFPFQSHPLACPRGAPQKDE